MRILFHFFFFFCEFIRYLVCFAGFSFLVNTLTRILELVNYTLFYC